MFIIGLGTGRCGTRSLTKLLGLQGIEAAHERGPVISWADEWPQLHVQQAIESRAVKWADVGFYYLPHAAKLMELYPELKFVCLKRDRKETVSSFMRIGDKRWFSESTDGWAKCFPVYGDGELRVLAEKYWDDYYATAASLECERFRVFDTLDLNSDSGVSSILGFVGITNPVIDFCRVTD